MQEIGLEFRKWHTDSADYTDENGFDPGKAAKLSSSWNSR